MLGYTASQDAALGKARVWILMVSFLLKRQIHALLDFGKFLFSPYNLLLLETFTWFYDQWHTGAWLREGNDAGSCVLAGCSFLEDIVFIWRCLRCFTGCGWLLLRGCRILFWLRSTSGLETSASSLPWRIMSVSPRIWKRGQLHLIFQPIEMFCYNEFCMRNGFVLSGSSGDDAAAVFWSERRPAAAVGPIVTVVVLVGNSSVVIGMWPAHFIWTYYCVMKTKRLGLVLKIFLLVMLPLPLILWPILGILGSLVVAIGYGFFAPLIATFEAVGEGVVDKLYHCFASGCVDTIKGACTLVVDFTDFCFHSYFSYMDDLCEKVTVGETPMDVKLTKLPSCLLVCLLGVILDVPMISIVALCKSPYLLLRGWHRLFHDLIGREGPFLETVCVPFAGLAILLWPLGVIGALVTAFLCSFLLGLYGGVVVHQEDSLRMGLAYIVAVVSIFDEYTNDLLYLREGSWLPRPRYRKSYVDQEHCEQKNEVEQNKTKNGKVLSGLNRTKLASERSRTMKKAIEQLKPIQIWDWLFRSCEINGRILLGEGLITVADIEESDEVEVSNLNWPNDKVLDWILGPLLIMKDQIRRLQLDENEEACLRKLILTSKNEKPKDWDGEGFPSDDNIRKAQLQAIFRRLQGIVGNMSRIPSFRRRFNSLVKSLYLEAIESGALTEARGGSASGSKTSDGRKRQNKSIARWSSLDVGGGSIVTSKCDASTEENHNLMQSSSNAAAVRFSRAKDGTSCQQLHIMLNMIANEKCVRFH
ncbi:hypothetical protein MUK42_16520 [Musa troglodytarum]|uniref:Steroid nuclear receptor ligand-binding n=1 Tax=Musa troglodytarum TaxID=320322 RepID=A0A9E7HH95_9LILI|nr:hypothetical protein MUK42_16520 [Musa troglodytarum]